LLDVPYSGECPFSEDDGHFPAKKIKTEWKNEDMNNKDRRKRNNKEVRSYKH
jgi:hypothetical protein